MRRRDGRLPCGVFDLARRERSGRIDDFLDIRYCCLVRCSKPCKVRRLLVRGGEMAAAILLCWLFVGALVAWFIGLPSEPSPKEGQPCGPGYVWTNTGGIDPDLSCERER